MKELEEAIKHTLQENTVVIFHTERANVQSLNESLNHLRKTFERHNITAMACAKGIDITVIPSGSGVTIAKKEPDGTEKPQD